MSSFFSSQPFNDAVAIARNALITFKDRQVFIYGSGEHTANLLKHIDLDIRQNISGIFDSNLEQSNLSKCLGLPIYPSHEIKKHKPGVIIVSSFTFHWKILRHLKALTLEGCELIQLYKKYPFENPVKKHSLTIETTDLCNLKCAFCPQSHGPLVHGSKAKSFMKFDRFKYYIDSILSEGEYFEDALVLHWIGEPFLHKDHIEMLNYALEKKDHYNILCTDSNFNTVTEKDIDRLLAMANNNLVFTLALDAVTQNVYKELRINGDINRVHKNIAYLIKKRKELKLLNPRLNFQFILQKENAHQISEFVDKWSKAIEESDHYVGDSITVMRLIERANGGGALQAQNDLYDKAILESGLLEFNPPHIKINICRSRNWGNDKTALSDDSVDSIGLVSHKPCPGLWKTPVICSDGRLTVCCSDADMKLAIADLNKENFSKTWNQGDKITYLRMLHILGLKDKIESCKFCDGINWIQMSKKEIDNYLQSIDPDLLDKTLKKIEDKFKVSLSSQQ